MTSRDLSMQDLVKALLRKQRKHQKLVGKVEKDTARLDRRKAKLHTLETRIADLERNMADPHGTHARPGDGPASRKRAQLIFNPSSGDTRGDSATRLAHIVDSLSAHGIRPQIGIKTSGQRSRTLAREAVRAGLELVVVAGGDGTIEEVAPELIGSATTLGIIPIGTMNNLARSLGVPLDTDEACSLIGMGTTRHIDLGRVFSSDHADSEYFLEGAGIGLSAVAALAGQSFEKRRWNEVLHALRKLFNDEGGTIKVQMDDTMIETHSRIVTVSNAPIMAMNMLVAPDAKMDDGMLDVVVYDGLGSAKLAEHFAAAAKGSAHHLQMYRARHVTLTAERSLLTNTDKDVKAERQVLEIEVLPRAISVIVGNGIGLTVPVDGAPLPPPLHGEPHANGPAEGPPVKAEPAEA